MESIIEKLSVNVNPSSVVWFVRFGKCPNDSYLTSGDGSFKIDYGRLRAHVITLTVANLVLHRRVDKDKNSQTKMLSKGNKTDSNTKQFVMVR